MATAPPRPRPGEILTGAKLRAALCDGTTFEPSSVDESAIGVASYDLRIARDMLIVPGRTAGSGVAIYDQGQYFDRGVLTLEPGQTAYVSTEERAQFAWNNSGTLGPKFSLAIDGLVVLTGLLVDPGYGLEWDGKVWKPSCPSQRLHFILANAGSTSIGLMPGRTPVVRIQIIRCEEPSDQYKLNAHYDDAWERFRDRLTRDPKSSIGLDYFSALGPRIALLEGQRDAVDQRVTVAELAVRRIVEGSNYVVVFGVYLLSATVFGVTLSVILASLANFPKDTATALNVVAFLAIVAFVLAQLLTVVYGLRYLKSKSGN